LPLILPLMEMLDGDYRHATTKGGIDPKDMMDMKDMSLTPAGEMGK